MVIHPSWQKIEDSIRGREGVIVSAELFPIPDPVSVFYRLKESGIKAYWLDSARYHPKTGRYSFIGLNPLETFRDIPSLREVLYRKRVAILDDLPPFTSGLIGYFSYDFGNPFVSSLVPRPSSLVNDCEWVLVQTVISWDHQENRCWVTEPFYPDRQDQREYREIVERLLRYQQLISEDVPPHPAPPSARFAKGDLSPHWGERGRPAASPLGEVRGLDVHSIRFEMDQPSFERMVLCAKEYIACGDIYQANLSQRISANIEGDPFELYLRLRRINPSPFACYLPMSQVTIAGSSPERLVKLEGNFVETRPIAGTRPRIAQDELADHRYAEELLLSPKERAEHIMLVDLERNDLGRVCEFGSVRVNEFMVVEEYSHVRHIVSNVVGRLRRDCDQFDLIGAAFPGGTITGTPKIRSMEVIEELEPVRRGLYTGSVGYLSFSGEMDLNIVIRTFLITQGRLFIQVGAGIVADSIPEKEYEETLRKGQALLEAIQSVKNIMPQLRKNVVQLCARSF